MDELKTLLQRVGDMLGAATNPEDATFVGEPYRDELLTIRGQVLASINAVPADAKKADASYEQLKSQISTILGAITVLGSVIKGRNAEKATALAGVPAEIAKAVKAKVDAGELLTKETATSLATTARTEGETSGFTKGRLLGDRRSALALASIPAEVISSAPESVLLDDEAKFNAARDAAKDRVGKLAGVGLTCASASFRTLPWATSETFDASLATFAEIAAASKKGVSLNSADPKAAKATGLTAPVTDAKPATKFEISATTVIC